MKTLASIILFIILNPAFSAGGNGYDKEMKAALEKMYQSASISDFTSVANQFDRIANIEPDSWLPQYHAAYARVMMGAMEQDLLKKDPYLDAAQKNLDAVEKMEHDAVERMALQGFLYMIRMSVDPARGIELGQKSAMLLNQAYMTDKENPRAVLMLGQFNHGSATYMGGDTSVPCAKFDLVLQLLEQPKGTGSDPFMPSWGKNIALSMQGQCQ
jgi:hypothetical protein